MFLNVLKKFTMIAAVCAPISLASASAATFTFGGPASQPSGYSTPEATFTVDEGGIVLVDGQSLSGVPGRWCFLGVDSGCAEDGMVEFLAPVSNLTFEVDGWNSGDSVTISAFNGAALLSSLVVSSNLSVDFSVLGTITKLVFDDNSSNVYGLAYRDFSFDIGPAAPVPVPAALPLFAGALAAGGMLRRRAKKAS